MRERNPQPHGEPTRRWKRTAVLLLLLLVAGAMVNVAVAWSIALSFSGWLESDRELPADTFRGWRLEPPSHWPPLHIGAGRRWSLTIVSGIASQFEFDAETEAMTKSESYGIYQWYLGWPMRAVQAEIWSEFVIERIEEQPPVLTYRFEGHPPSSLWHAGISIDRGIFTLPIRPVLPGFIINTLFYALLLWLLFWLLFFVPFAARRMLRRRRGLCEKCAYPVGVSPVCTECGAAVAPREHIQNEPRA